MIAARSAVRLRRPPALALPRVDVVLARALLAGFLGFLLVQPAFALLVAGASVALRVVDPPVTALMLYRAATTDAPIRPISFVPLRRLSWRAGAMFVAVEDHTFYQHHGVDLQAIRDAQRINRQLGRIYHGGSTITMQLARTLFLTPNRTYVRKYFEVIAAVTMDAFLSKERILELYVNTIEFGSGVYGIRAAVLAHYGKTDPARLTTDQLRRLVTIVASPLFYDVDTFARRRALAERYEFLVSVFP
jgi:monofunctional biosynthetic peptidoglycan transglycosylase